MTTKRKTTKKKPVKKSGKKVGSYGEVKVKLCSCGSNYPSSWAMDANGHPLIRTCNKCHITKMGMYPKGIIDRKILRS